MITRELPREEWHRLKGLDMWRFVERQPESIVAIMVVEDGAEIVGCWSLVTIIHAEGVWIRPSHRKSATVARSLIGAMWTKMGDLDIDGVLTAADSPQVGANLDKLGAKPLPIIPYYWARRTEAESVGAAFHRSFEVSSGHPPDHPPMREHDRAVGTAILQAFSGDVETAEQAYNQWAKGAGFESAHFIGHAKDGRLEVVSGPYLFLIAPSGVCEVQECQFGQP